MEIKKLEEHVLLVGAGYMGVEYAKVLNALSIPYTVVTRGQEKARIFKEKTGHDVVTGGIENFVIYNKEIFSTAIVALPVEMQKSCVIHLIENNIKKILLEKPGMFYLSELQEINQKAKENDVIIKIAYNRRFYNSVLDAERIINEDGGITSIFFEFTEKDFEEKKDSVWKWFIGNSSHVIDLAFYLAGIPKTIHGISRVDNSHIFYMGMGVTERNIPFSYMANYLAPGRWKVEAMTSRHRLIFSPMEKLHIQNLNSFQVYEQEIANQDDILFKPGIYKEVDTFIHDIDNKRLPSSSEQEAHMYYYKQIMNGTEDVEW